MKEITSRYLQDIGACKGACEQFKKELNGGHSMSVSKVFTRLEQIKRLDWANWLIVRLMTREQRIRYAIYAAEQVISLYEEEYPEDKRPRQAIEAARLCLDNPSEENKAAAESAADAAAESAARSAAALKKMQLKIINYGLRLIGVSAPKQEARP